MKNGKSKWPSVKAWHNKVVKDVGNFKRKSVKINILSGDVNVWRSWSETVGVIPHIIYVGLRQF